MKYEKLLAVLCLDAIAFKKPLFGGQEKASFSEEELQKIEDALAEKDTSALEKEIESLKEEKSQYLQEVEAFKNTVNQALTDNNLSVSEDVTANISLLSKTCKEYGLKRPTPTLIPNNGQENSDKQKLIGGYLNPEDEHNKFLNSL